MFRLALLLAIVAVATLSEPTQTAQPPVAPPPRVKLTPEQQEKLKERDRLDEEADKLEAEGKLAEARTAVEKKLAIEREVFGDTHADVADTLDWLTVLCVKLEDTPAAREYGKKCLTMQKQINGEQHWKTTDARLSLADVELWAKFSKEQRIDLSKADQLIQEVIRLSQRGEHPKAQLLCEEALAIRRKVLGVKHPKYATTLNTLGFLYNSKSLFAKVEPLYKEALAIREEVLGKKHPHYVISLNNLASLYKSQGLFAKAEPLYKEALALRKEVLGVKHTDYALSLNNLASLYHAQGLFAKAEALYKEALAVRKEVLGVKHTDYALSLNNLAFLYEAQGLYAKAEPLYKEALALRKEVLGVKHPQYASSLSNLAFLYKSQGLLAKAEPLYKEALAISKEVLGKKHPQYATCLNNLASLYESQGLLAKAEPLYQEALALRKEVLGVKHPQYATSLHNLAGLYSSQGLFAKAEAVYQEALAINKEVLGVKHPQYATILNSLGSLYKSQGLCAKAEPLYTEALAIRKEVLGVKHPDYAGSLHSLGVLYKSQGLFAKAEPLYTEALAIRKEVLGVKHPDYATSLGVLAGLHRSQRLFAKAEPLYTEALVIYKEVLGVKHPAYATGLNNLGSLYFSQGLFSKAEPLYQEAIHILEEHLEETAVIQSEATQLTFVAQTRGYLDNLLHLKDTNPGDVYAVAFRWRGAVTARQTFARATRDTDPAARQTLDELKDVTRRLSNIVSNPPKPGSGVNVTELRGKLDEEREALERKLVLQSKEFAKYQESRNLKVPDIQKLLPVDAVLVDFLVYGDRIAAFVITPKSITRVDLKASSNEIAEMLNDFRSEPSLKRTRPVQGDDDKSVLREAVWEPLVPYLTGVNTVLICPDGPLCQLPFAALRGNDPKKYLLEEIEIVVIPVPKLLPELLAPRPAGSPNLLVVGDVDFGGDPGAGRLPGELTVSSPTRAGGPLAWKPLAATAGEIQKIEELFRKNVPGSVVESLTKADATEAAIRRVSGKNRYLHFATHGFFDDPKPTVKFDPRTDGVSGEPSRLRIPNPGLLCGLVCAGANKPTPDDDGVLTALEIANLDLRGVDLAVLSACETGLGEIAGGDGVLGLQRAFQLAGAKTTVTSLWKVDDEVTGVLMTRFYENRLKHGMPVLKALREAQLWVLNNAVKAGVLKEEPKNGRRTPPMYWAAFVLAGDWR